MNKYLSLEDLENSKDKFLSFTINDYIDGIDSVDPVCAQLNAVSMGEFVRVYGHVRAKVKLICDLCLEEFVQEIDFDMDEMFTKNSLFEFSDSPGHEFEIKDGQFITDLEGKNEIDIYDLLYQSVILHYPNKKVCGINCKGRDFLSEDKIPDPRLDVFKNIQINENK